MTPIYYIFFWNASVLPLSWWRPVEEIIYVFLSRALYDRLAEVEQDLSFKKDDILYVDDTLPQGNFGCWMAWQLDENAQKLERGQIPSKYMWVTAIQVTYLGLQKCLTNEMWYKMCLLLSFPGDVNSQMSFPGWHILITLNILLYQVIFNATEK